MYSGCQHDMGSRELHPAAVQAHRRPTLTTVDDAFRPARRRIRGIASFGYDHASPRRIIGTQCDIGTQCAIGSVRIELGH